MRLCVSVHLLLGQPPLNLLVVTDAVGDGSGQLCLHARKPRAEVTHVLIQLLHRHQSLLQLLHPTTNKHTHTHTEFYKLCKQNVFIANKLVLSPFVSNVCLQVIVSSCLTWIMIK